MASLGIIPFDPTILKGRQDASSSHSQRNKLRESIKEMPDEGSNDSQTLQESKRGFGADEDGGHQISKRTNFLHPITPTSGKPVVFQGRGCDYGAGARPPAMLPPRLGDRLPPLPLDPNHLGFDQTRWRPLLPTGTSAFQYDGTAEGGGCASQAPLSQVSALPKTAEDTVEISDNVIQSILDHIDREYSRTFPQWLIPNSDAKKDLIQWYILKHPMAQIRWGMEEFYKK